jgi:hypothetical protein
MARCCVESIVDQGLYMWKQRRLSDAAELYLSAYLNILVASFSVPNTVEQNSPFRALKG